MKRAAGIVAGLICMGAMAGVAQAQEEKLTLRVQVMRAYIETIKNEPSNFGPWMLRDYREGSERMATFSKMLEAMLTKTEDESPDRAAAKKLQSDAEKLGRLYKAIVDLGGIEAAIKDEAIWAEYRKIRNDAWGLEAVIMRQMGTWAVEHFGAPASMWQ